MFFVYERSINIMTQDEEIPLPEFSSHCYVVNDDITKWDFDNPNAKGFLLTKHAGEYLKELGVAPENVSFLLPPMIDENYPYDKKPLIQYDSKTKTTHKAEYKPLSQKVKRTELSREEQDEVLAALKGQ